MLKKTTKRPWFVACFVGVLAYTLSIKFDVLSLPFSNTITNFFTGHQQKEEALIQQLSNTHADERLSNQSREFGVPQIIAVTEGVFVAIGYAIANSVVVECDESLTIIDTTESIASATKIRNDLFRSYPHLQYKPVKHIVYTHYHPDHTFGTKGWVDDIHNPPVVIAHPKTVKELERILSLTSTVTQFRALRQFGTLLKKLQDELAPVSARYGFSCNNNNKAFVSGIHNKCGGDMDGHDHDHDHEFSIDEDEELRARELYQNQSRMFINSGIGPYLVYGDPLDRSMFYPTLVLNRSVEILNLDGVEFQFYHAPGETVDQIFIYLPSKGVLMPADNIYRAFPNIYAIRGSPTRSARDWTKSIDAMRRLSPPPKFLIPHHTQPVYGEETIYDLLTSYRDGIAFVHDQTIRYINLGYFPDDIVTLVRQSMPHRLLAHPFLQEFYGTIDWSVRAVFQAYLGWFSGDSVDLYPLSKQQQALRLLKMVHSIDVLLETAEKNVLNHRHRDDCQWALQLSDGVLSLPNKAHENRKDKLLSESVLKEIYSIDENKHVAVNTDPILKTTEKEYQKALEIKVKSLQCLAEYMTSANGRNYYLTSAYELMSQKPLVFATKEDREWVSFAVPLRQVFEMLPVRYKADEMKGYNHSVCFHFTDIHEFYVIVLRDGVVELLHNKYEAHNQKPLEKDCIDASDTVTEITSTAFRSLIAADVVQGALMYTQGKIKIKKGSVVEISKFRGYFEMQ